MRPCAHAREDAQEEIVVVHHGGQRRVDLVRHAGDELAERRHLGVLHQAPLRGAQLAEQAPQLEVGAAQIVDEAVAVDEDARRGEQLDAVDRLAQVVVDAGGRARRCGRPSRAARR